MHHGSRPQHRRYPHDRRNKSSFATSRPLRKIVGIRARRVATTAGKRAQTGQGHISTQKQRAHAGEQCEYDVPSYKDSLPDQEFVRDVATRHCAQDASQSRCAVRIKQPGALLNTRALTRRRAREWRVGRETRSRLRFAAARAESVGVRTRVVFRSPITWSSAITAARASPKAR